MIVTLTANPSLDRTIELNAPVLRGQVQRAIWAGQQPGGKGVNVSRAVAGAGHATQALLPGDIDDPVLTGLDSIGLGHDSVRTGMPIRSNITVTEPDGTTTKINEPGSPLSASSQTELLDLVASRAAEAAWVVLAGSLPPGVGHDFYACAIERIRELPDPPLIAVDTSGAPLAEALRQSPDVIKPNAEELAELLGAAGLLETAGLRSVSDTSEDASERLRTDEILAIAARLESSPELTARATQTLLNASGPRPRSILATLGAGGAVFAIPDAAWHAQHPPMEVVSTVGAGDSTLAGYLLGRVEGEEPRAALSRAVAYGAAAARLRGTGVPTPTDVRLDAVTVRPLAVSAPPTCPLPPTYSAQPAHPAQTKVTEQLDPHQGAVPTAEEA